MKIFYSEHNKDYSTYTFDYAIYAQMEHLAEIPAIYQKGFLPYSNDIQDEKEIFYLARSLRVNLSDFKDSSENKRVDRKLEELELSLQICKSEDFNFEDASFMKFCMEYANSRFSGQAMDTERFRYICSRKILSHIFIFRDRDKNICGYVFTHFSGDVLHYWFAFFSLDLLNKYPIGKWLMWKLISWSAENKLKQVYLGTCYGEKSLYKVRDFKGLSFFDGSVWNRDMKLLKTWCKNDMAQLPSDRFKIKLD